MSEDPVPVSSARREALMVWLKFLALLAVLGVVGWVMLHLTEATHGH